MHMVDVAEPLIGATPSPAKDQRWTDLSVRIRGGAEYVVIPLFALVVSGVLFSQCSYRWLFAAVAGCWWRSCLVRWGLGAHLTTRR